MFEQHASIPPIPRLGQLVTHLRRMHESHRAICVHCYLIQFGFVSQIATSRKEEWVAQTSCDVAAFATANKQQDWQLLTDVQPRMKLPS